MCSSDLYVYVVTDANPRDLGNQDPEDAAGDNTFSRVHYARAVFETPGLINNTQRGDTAIVYRESDLVISNLTVDPVTTQSGGSMSATFTVTNQGTRDTREARWYDRVFLSQDAALDSTDFEIGEFEHLGALPVGASYDRTLNFTLPEGISGEWHIIVYTDADVDGATFTGAEPSLDRGGNLRVGNDLVSEYRGEGNNLSVQPITIDLRPAADLRVSRVTIPERVLAGQTFSLSYRVTNQGEGATPPLQTTWHDRVYLSADEFLDLNADRYLTEISHTGALAAGAGYDVTLDNLQLPPGLSGSFYVFVITDPVVGNAPNGEVFEAGRERNNARPSDQPLLIELPPPADLVVDSIVMPGTGTVNGTIDLSWSVTNQGVNPAQGSWYDSVYLSADGNWDLEDRFLGRVLHGGGLAAGASYTGELKNVLLPPSLAGQYRIIVRTDIFNQVYESADEGNNLRSSPDTIAIEVPSLTLGVALETALVTTQSRLYRIDVPAGETLRLTLDSTESAAANEVFVRYNALPDGSNYDAAFDAPLAADQTVLLPTTQAGTYYVLVRQFSGPDQPQVTLKAETLPFQVDDVKVDQGGDGRWVTVTVTGARFSAEALLKLVRPGIEEIEPARYQVVDATTIIATFDLRNRQLGLYDVAVLNPDGAQATLPYRFLVERALPVDVTIGLGGPRVVPAGETGLYGISLQSLTNVDTPYVYFEFGAPEMGENARVYGLPYVTYSSNVGGNPDGARTDVPWSSLDSEVNTVGFMLDRKSTRLNSSHT